MHNGRARPTWAWWSASGDTAKGEFALDAAVKLLTDYVERRFGTPYPGVPKRDLVAGPGRASAAPPHGELGATPLVSTTPCRPSEAVDGDRQARTFFVVVAHEMAHPVRFGNLVTMAWWDDLWLNEGFASRMENKATNHFHPGVEHGLLHPGRPAKRDAPDSPHRHPPR